MTDKPNIPPRKPGEGTRDYRKRIHPDYKKNRRTNQNNQQPLGDDDIQAQGDAKGNPTKEDLKPLTPEQIEANRRGIEEAKKRMRGGPLDKDNFLDFSAREALKIGLQAAQTAASIQRWHAMPYRAAGWGVKALTIGNLGGYR